MLRSDWKFTYEAQEVAAAAASKLAQHDGHIDFWREQQATVMNTIRSEGIEINEKIAVEQMANGVLVDWKNIFDDDGKEMPYSVATCKSLLAKLPELRLAIAGASLDMDNFRTETRNDVLGNSSST